MVDVYENARQVLDGLSTSGLQWKIRQPVTDDNSQAIYDEIDYLVRELTKVKEKLLPFTLNQTITSYVQQVIALKEDCPPAKARQVINNLLVKNLVITDEQMIDELMSMV